MIAAHRMALSLLYLLFFIFLLFRFVRFVHAWTGVEGAASGAGLGAFFGHQAAMGIPLGLPLGAFVTVDGVGAFTHEVLAQGSHDDHRIHRTVEAPVMPRLETVQEQHHLGHLEETELLDDDSGQLLHLLLVEFFLHTAVIPQVIELRQHPHHCGLVMIGVAQGHQHGGSAKESSVLVLGAGVLQLGIHHLHEGCQVRMGRQQGIDLLLQLRRWHGTLLDDGTPARLGDGQQGRQYTLDRFWRFVSHGCFWFYRF